MRGFLVALGVLGHAEVHIAFVAGGATVGFDSMGPVFRQSPAEADS